MSDWGATTGPSDIEAGLDQESGAQLDKKVWFDHPLREAIASGAIDKSLVSSSVRRILRSIYAVGAERPQTEHAPDYVADAEVAKAVAQEGIVLLKNDGILPLANAKKKILVVGRFADAGVWSGGGSSQVIPTGGPAERIRTGGSPFLNVNGFQVIMPSSPLDALRAVLSEADIAFDSGYVPETAAARAEQSDMVIVFANKWQVESLDAAGLSLPDGQNETIAAIARVNPNVVVVLETGNPVAMPWISKVRGVIEAWYSGQEGGKAIAAVLAGQVNPSGRLPMTFPKSPSQAPRKSVPGLGLDDNTALALPYVEGADVGYRWYARKGLRPLFPFGFGLSYTKFEHGRLTRNPGSRWDFTATVTNTGSMAGADVLQLYLVSFDGTPFRRLVGFEKIELKPGEQALGRVTIDPRLIAVWRDDHWKVLPGRYSFALGYSAQDLMVPIEIQLPGEDLPF